MEVIAKLKKTRSSARGWTTRSSNALEALLAGSSASRIELEDAIEDFDKRLASLDEAQAALELEIDDTKELEFDIDDADKFRRQARIPRVKAAQRLVDMVKAEQPETSRSHSSGNDSGGSLSSKVRLPRLELPKFKGELTEWQSFWDRFMALVDDSSIPVISKFSYLLSLLEGEAKSVIQGLALTTSNYPVACTMLKERFGRPERIIFAHIQALLSANVPLKTQGPKYVSSLWKLQDELLIHIRSLKTLGVSGDQYGVFLTPVILSRLPHDIRMEWSREGSGHESDLNWLLNFLQKEIERRERSETFKDVSTGKVDTRIADSEKRKMSSASALQTSSEVGLGQFRCGFCNKRHKSEKCWDVLKLSSADREERIRGARLCFKCLGKGHVSRGCRHKCTKCNGNHNILCCSKTEANSVKDSDKQLCDPIPTEVVSPPGDDSVSYVNHVGMAHSKPRLSQNLLSQTCSVLQTAKVRVFGETGLSREATVLFDTGSDRSYVSSNFVGRIKPKWVSSEPISYSAFGGGKSNKGKLCNVYDMTLMDCKDVGHSLLAVEVPTICTPLIRPSVPCELLSAFTSVQLADDYKNNRHMTVDILVGLDAYWRFVDPSKFHQVEGLVAQESVFGWLLSGSWTTLFSREIVSTQMLCIENVSDSALRNFWDLESVGIRTDDAVFNRSFPDPVLKKFSETIKFDNGRYEVALPWKSSAAKDNIINNERLARKRLEGLNRKFEKDPNLREQYDAVFQGYEQEGIIEEVPSSEIISPYPIYYLPHRPVVRESSSSTKVRPVFDASAVSYNGISLNDCLESGPSLNPNLVEILIRFRRWKVALTADITKAFLQICIRREDQDVHRFLWHCQGSIRTMRFNRVPFGNKSSPFLLNATIKHHLESFPSSKVVEELRDNLYVDDWLSGADSIDEGCAKFTEACNILAQAGMSLSKWKSNSKILTDKFNQNLDHQNEQEAIKVLGMQWFSSLDCFSFDGLDLGSHLELVSTKRAVLSLIARLFDPLGLISPFVMFAKVLFQDVWRLGLDWDEVLPEELQFKFQKWVKGIEILKTWKINRCYSPDLLWKSSSGVELHAFGDACEKGYGACVYLRIPLQDGSFKVSFVVARARVAPVKRITIPRLELLGALLCARLLVFARSALHFVENVPFYCWTDSQVALSWIRGDPSRWKTFVFNRVVDIQSHTPPCHWHHCSGKDNPADLISRGAFADQIVSSSLWMNGPSWLSESTVFPQDETHSSLSEEYFCENDVVVCVSVNPPARLFEFEQWSDFSRVLNVVALVLRFSHNSYPGAVKLSGPLSYRELVKAKTKLFYCIQRDIHSREIDALMRGRPLHRGSSLVKLDPFLDDEGLLRIKGRLENADLSYESKHPIIIPSGHIAKILVRFQHGFLKHAGVSTLVSTLRSGYWIVRLRQLAKNVCRECVFCRRHDSKACSQPVAPLPELRVKSAPPFTITGLDYAGPLFCVDLPSKKLYILLFTCAVVRSVHLELTDSLSLTDCILAIRRFTSRRGLPSVFYSDNAKTFISAANQLQKYFGPLSPEWKFIAPRSPWWGGWWERLIRSVKSALRKTLGVKSLSRCELETTLHEVEACVNSRPLTFVGEEPDILNPLTPSHFLIGRTAGFQPEITEHYPPRVSAKDLSIRENVRQQQLDKFWNVWSNDYLRNLPPTVKGFVSKCNLKKGSIVLVKEDNIPRLSWPLGVVEEVFPGKDDIVRSVTVRTAKGVICRSVQRLHDLEMSSSLSEHLEEDVNSSESCEDPNLSSGAVLEEGLNISQPANSPIVSYSRRGRAIKRPVKLDL